MPALIAISRRTRTVIRVDWQPITRAQFWAVFCAFEPEWAEETEHKLDHGEPYEITIYRLTDSVFPLLKMIDNRLFFRAETYEDEED